MAKLHSKYERMTDSEINNAIIKRMELNTMIKNSRIHPIIPIEEVAGMFKRHFRDYEVKSLINYLTLN